MFISKFSISGRHKALQGAELCFKLQLHYLKQRRQMYQYVKEGDRWRQVCLVYEVRVCFVGGLQFILAAQDQLLTSIRTLKAFSGFLKSYFSEDTQVVYGSHWGTASFIRSQNTSLLIIIRSQLLIIHLCHVNHRLLNVSYQKAWLSVALILKTSRQYYNGYVTWIRGRNLNMGSIAKHAKFKTNYFIF